jgi:hypothetical protein
LLGGDDQSSTPSLHALQGRIELLRGDIVETAGAMQVALAAGVAMAAIPSDAGLLHGLRNARACWRSISESAVELKAVHAELASVLRQEGGGADPVE